jgi:hypothetical protein
MNNYENHPSDDIECISPIRKKDSLARTMAATRSNFFGSSPPSQHHLFSAQRSANSNYPYGPEDLNQSMTHNVIVNKTASRLKQRTSREFPV